MKYPTIKKALAILANDAGLDKHPIDLRDMRGVEVSSENYDGPLDLDRIEQFLVRLSADDLETLCIGDQDDQVKLWQGKPDGEMANAFLEEMFENIA